MCTRVFFCRRHCVQESFVAEDDDHASVATLAYLNEISAKGHLAAVEGEDGDLPTRTFIILNNAHDIGISSSATITADAVQLEALGAVGSTIAATTTGQECTESVSSTAGVTEIAPKKSGMLMVFRFWAVC